MEEQASLTLETERSERPVDRLLPVPPSNSPSTVLALIERVALDPRADVEKLERMMAMYERLKAKEAELAYNTDLRKFLDTSVSSISGHIAGATYRAGEPGAQATAQSERIRPWSVANRFQAVSQASMMSARLRNTELASQWLRR